MKTTFSSGVIVTSQWLNGAQQIYFDGQDLDWHYAPLGLNSLVQTGPNGLDSAYVSLINDQPVLNAAGLYVSGSSISGIKVVSGVWNFGYDPAAPGTPSNPTNIIANAPKSSTTNDKYNNAGGIPPIPGPSVPQKFAALDDPDIVTKLVLEELTEYILDTLEIDNGVYASATNPACFNYSVGAGNSPTICPA
jgi:hypothetical protein